VEEEWNSIKLCSQTVLNKRLNSHFFIFIHALIDTAFFFSLQKNNMDIDTAPNNKGKGKEKIFNLTAELDNLPWVEKYRPKTLDDLVSHENITSTSK
jgi:hypothetical protein